jgi:DNA-binding GntR family transcriptional regulator
VGKLRLDHLLELERRLEALSEEAPGWNEQQAQLDLELHQSIVNSSGNRRLAAYLENISLLIHSLRLVGYRRDHDARQAGREHLAIVRALRNRDLETSERLLADHIEASKRHALALFFDREANASYVGNGNQSMSDPALHTAAAFRL